MNTPKIFLQFSVLCGFMLYYLAFTSMGLTATIVDRFLREDFCGKSTHLWMYSVLNTMFSAGTLATFGCFPGGGEGARARALAITILHFGFVVWGSLLWTKNPAECLESISTKYPLIYIFHIICVWHNACFLILYTLHELYLGEKVGGDLTLMPEVNTHETFDYSDTAQFGAVETFVAQAATYQTYKAVETHTGSTTPDPEILEQYERHVTQDSPHGDEDSTKIKCVYTPVRDL